jgi:hypothetical protein
MAKGYNRIMPRRRRMLKRFATRSAWIVALTQGAVLLAFYVDPADPPPGVFGSLGQAIWAWMHEPSFYPLAAVIAAGLPLTVAAMLVRGPHRFWLAGSWAVFVPLLARWHGPRVEAMLRVLWEHGT